MNLGRIEGRWNHPVYIIGGGPSLLGFDFSRIDGFMLGCNRSAWDAGCDALFTLDQHFLRMCRPEILEFTGERYFAVPSNLQNHQPIDGCTYVMHDRGSGLCRNPERIYGVNTGYGALGLCYHKRAPRVYLLGLDFQPGKNRSHWHAGYSWHNKANIRYYDKWASNFEKARAQCDEIGMKVINVVGDNGSQVTAFPTIHLGDL